MKTLLSVPLSLSARDDTGFLVKPSHPFSFHLSLDEQGTFNVNPPQGASIDYHVQGYWNNPVVTTAEKGLRWYCQAGERWLVCPFICSALQVHAAKLGWTYPALAERKGKYEGELWIKIEQQRIPRTDHTQPIHFDNKSNRSHQWAIRLNYHQCHLYLLDEQRLPSNLQGLFTVLMESYVLTQLRQGDDLLGYSPHPLAPSGAFDVRYQQPPQHNLHWVA